jgi:hypothetical protein
MNEIITDYLDAKQLADRLTALELHSTSELARLERERNESQEKYATEATEHMLAVNKICNERDEALSQIAQAECRAERFCQERDELIDKNKKLNEEVDDLIRQRPLLIEDFKRERDEAREYSKATWQSLRDSQDEVLRLTFENRELSQSIEGWENKWKCAIDMAARAELERDEALKCAKEYYVEFIRNASSDNKISKPNPLNPFYKY